MQHSNSATLIVKHKTVLNCHSAALNNVTVNRAINSANSNSATSDTEALQYNINSEIRNSVT